MHGFQSRRACYIERASFGDGVDHDALEMLPHLDTEHRRTVQSRSDRADLVLPCSELALHTVTWTVG